MKFFENKLQLSIGTFLSIRTVFTYSIYIKLKMARGTKKGPIFAMRNYLLDKVGSLPTFSHLIL